MKNLEDKIGYRFKDKNLLETALTHSSYSNESRSSASSYERLEFLGDSILGLVTAEFLYSHTPQLPEGRMTRLRAELVCEANLHKVALRLGLGEYMRLGKGEERTGGRERISILADMVEAIIAAMYLDSGIDIPREFIIKNILKDADLGEQHRIADYKSELQELVQRDSECTISYEHISESGPDHDKRFTYAVRINGSIIGEGTGRTKKEAEQFAAMIALETLKG